MPAVRLAALLSLALLAGPAFAENVVQPVAATLETPTLTEDDGDADDPAFWVNPADPAKTLVVTAVKNGGIRVYDLSGKLVQAIGRVKTEAGKGRINNVDVLTGFTLADGSTVDVVVASDRGLDVVRVYRIDAAAAEPLVEITDLSVGRAFPTKPDPKGGADLDNPLDDQMTVYGITAFKGADGKAYAVGTQRTNPRLGVFALEPVAGGKVAVRLVRDVRVPFAFAGQDLTVENEDDPLLDWNPQFEGVVADRATGLVYAGQEDVGLWLIDPAKGAVVGDGPFYATRGSAKSSSNRPDSAVARDVEGLTIYYGAKERYLLASSQGGAHGDAPAPDAPFDDSFVVFRIDGTAPAYLGAFRVAAAGAIDAVQESDGADVIATAVPGFPNGLFVTQDGYDDDLNGLDGETAATNFKFVDWAAIAGSFEPKLDINTGYDPRK